MSVKITSTYTNNEGTRLDKVSSAAGLNRAQWQKQKTLAALVAAEIPPPSSSPSPSPPISVRRGEKMGLSCWGSPENMDRAVALGLGWIRVSIEQGWAYETRLAGWVTDAHDRGLKVLQCCQRNGKTYPAGGETNFASWCASLINAGIDAIEILNEPNIPQFWLPTPDPVAAARYVGTAALAIRAEHPTIPIITPGLSPAPKPAWPAGFWPAMWDALTDEAKACISGVGHHPYCYPQDPNLLGIPDHPEWNSSWQTILIHDAMRERGIGHLPIWMTEYGSPTAAFASENDQAAHMRRTFDALDLWQQQSLSIVYGPQFIHTSIDGQTASVPKEMTMGMFRADGSRKPVGDVVIARANELI